MRAGSRAERLFSVAVFPVSLTAALVACIWLFRAGYPDISASVPIVGGLFLVFALERIAPLHQSWLRSQGDLPTDLAYLPLSGLSGGLGTALGALVAVPVAAALSERFGAGLWPRVGWPLELAAALVIAELPKYWLHRMQHETDFLWRFHATHHSAPRLYFVNAGRFHPFDLIADGLVGMVPLIALGCPGEIIALFTVTSAVHGYFQHANLQLKLGPLNYFFSMAELHRWHHSKLIAEANHNYGQNVCVWDLVFGTWFLPSDREPPEDIGIPDLPSFPMRIGPQLLSPFRWRQIKEADAQWGRLQEADGK